jgi:TPR repeat protein
MSRLPPLTIQHEFGNRPGYFSSLSNSTVNSPEHEFPPTSPRPQTSASPREVPSNKHHSFYPSFGGDEPHETLPFRNNLSPIGEARPSPPPVDGYFSIPRTMSPEPAEPRIGLQEATPITPHMPQSNSQSFPRQTVRQQSSDSLSVKPQGPFLQPKSPGSFRSPRMSPSIRSVPDSSDEVEDMSLGNSYDSLQARNLSPSSSLSRSHSPLTPLSAPSIPRSPSLSSEYSAGGSQLPRPAFNFSRPMSSASRPSLDVRPSFDIPSRQASDESAYMRPSFDSMPRRQDSADSPITNYTNDVVHTPVSMTSEDFRRQSAEFPGHPAATYTYSKFSLPRGRKLDRQSIGIEDFLNNAITWDQPNGQGQARPPSPQSPPRSFDRQRSARTPTLARNASMERGAPSLTSSNSTIRARTEGSVSGDVTAQEHCDKAIELHEAGEFLKSTYHFRLAARAGLPEGMFWYGLACRHGWGMRENKAEGMQWLRRAVDSGQLEVAEDEDQTKHGQPTDIAKRNRHRAQYAVAIYELGKCYMNGWGASQDKSLALRCYEIAGNWGDADALVEAGYCYAEGVGCKKDMRKAARFYRSAEAKGVSMVGNSWYVCVPRGVGNLLTGSLGSTRTSTWTTRQPSPILVLSGPGVP